MEALRRVFRSNSLLYVLYAVSAVALLYALTTPFVVDPLFGFLLAGIIPGTDIVLAPETILLILTDLFGLMLAGTLLGWLIRRRRLERTDFQQVALRNEATSDVSPFARTLRRIRTHAAVRHAERLSARAMQTNNEIRHATLLRHASTRGVDTAIRATLINVAYVILNITTKVGAAIVLIASMIVMGLRISVAAFIGGLRWFGRMLVSGIILLLRGVTWVFYLLIVAIGLTIDWMIRASKSVWKQSQPSLRRFDSWLEVRYRVLVKAAQKSLRRNESLQVFVIVCKDTLANVRRLLTKE